MQHTIAFIHNWLLGLCLEQCGDWIIGTNSSVPGVRLPRSVCDWSRKNDDYDMTSSLVELPLTRGQNGYHALDGTDFLVGLMGCL